MPQDAFTLRHVARELDQALRGGKVNKIIQPSRDEADILFYAGGMSDRMARARRRAELLYAAAQAPDGRHADERGIAGI